MREMLRPIHNACCAKVLPISYDDSLSYYEAICKLTGKLNDVINYVNNNLEYAIREQLDKLFLDAMYDADTETLILRLGMEG